MKSIMTLGILLLTFFAQARDNHWNYAFIENKGQIIDQHCQPNPAVKYLWDGERLINLKVILKDDYISVFYIDLMLYNLQNNFNQTANVHGMINTGWSSSGTPQNAFYSKSFKLLIH